VVDCESVVCLVSFVGVLIRMVFYRNGYIAVRSGAGHHRGSVGEARYKNWFIVKSCGDAGILSVGDLKVSMPVEMMGKRVRIRVEVIEDG
jgi:hypothetical protein